MNKKINLKFLISLLLWINQLSVCPWFLHVLSLFFIPQVFGEILWADEPVSQCEEREI
jgi:hypothetical protein